MTPEVIVTGGGPVGLMTACELQLAGISTVVLERLPKPSGQSRALGLHSRTVEVFDQRGLLDRVEEEAPVWPKGHFAGLRKVDLTKLRGAYNYALMVPQSRTEELLARRATELGADIRRGHRLTGLETAQDGVTAVVEGPHGEYRLAAGHLVGCDGGASTVRKLAGIAFPGTPSTINAVLGDVEILGDQPQARELHRLPGGLFGMIPLGAGLFRVVAVEFDTEPVPRDVPMTVAELHRTAQRVSGLDLPIGASHWLSRFGNATRQAETYRKGRVLLVGDAAHIHFPAGGQGLNTGIQDAVNLGWKLAATIRGHAPDGLLDTYHAERHPVGHRVCLNTRAQLALMHPGEHITPLRDLFSELMDLDQVNTYLAEMITGLDIRYPMATGDATAPDGTGPDTRHPLLGRRVPALRLTTTEGATSPSRLLHQADGLLLDFTADGSLAEPAAPWKDRVRHIPCTPEEGQAEADGLRALLVRPDGYVAWASTDARDTDRLRTALTTWFGAPAAGAPHAPRRTP
ncbi:FAD-dependent monooxygenase [Streptomyces sp. NPDC057555]|uniref:FAD-dependent monooxygenase n=1 Tax=Streptomyces sp. NPDC057555 TaxID=3346166 RepID=UPI0036AF5605